MVVVDTNVIFGQRWYRGSIPIAERLDIGYTDRGEE